MNSLLRQSLIPFPAINCGNIPSISYPIWGVNLADCCGQSGFEIECQDNVPTISMRNITFRILEMSSSNTARKLPDPVATGACKSMVPVPVFETAALALDSNQTTIQEAIDGGFELGLKIDNGPCNSCEASGGKCGLNTTNGDFICFCQDQPYAATTCSSSKSGSSSLLVGVTQLALLVFLISLL
ncbi:hypothetical protein M0R45_033309 [Rubus argutus]|uniref:non-specific serine/threonine protein kinase n=1 Tax=Rubus argutus TaxID=59490 RepID=A0AAW1WK76_RUBAR